MAELVQVLEARFERAIALDELDKAKTLLTQWSGHEGEMSRPEFYLAEARMFRALGQTRASKKVAQQLLDEGLQPQDEGFMGACLLAGIDSKPAQLDPAAPRPFWVEVELHRWHTLSPKPDLLIKQAESLGDETLLAFAWLIACETWLRLENDVKFQAAWAEAATRLQGVSATRLLPQLELFGVIGHLRAHRDDRAWHHGRQAQACLQDDQRDLQARLSLWVALLHLRAGRLSDVVQTLANFQTGRKKSLLLGHWAALAALAWAEGKRSETSEALIRFSVAEARVGVGSLSALGFLIWLADAAESQGHEAIRETALRAALGMAGRSGLARTVVEIDDRLREEHRTD